MSPDSMSGIAAVRALHTMLRADFRRDNGVESRVTLAIWRANQVATRTRGPLARVVRAVARLMGLVWIRALMRAELPARVWVEGGLKLGHGGRGVIIHPLVQIGARATIFHDVTLGVSRGYTGVPTLDDGVTLGAGARVLGDVHLHAGCTVAANSLLLTDAAAGTTYIGVPAQPTQPHPKVPRSA